MPAAKKTKTPAEIEKAKQEKAAKFVEVAEKRIPNVLKGIQSIGKLAGKHYIHTKPQSDAIVSELRAEVDKVEKAFTSGPAAVVQTFKLPR